MGKLPKRANMACAYAYATDPAQGPLPGNLWAIQDGFRSGGCYALLTALGIQPTSGYLDTYLGAKADGCLEVRVGKHMWVRRNSDSGVAVCQDDATCVALGDFIGRCRCTGRFTWMHARPSSGLVNDQCRCFSYCSITISIRKLLQITKGRLRLSVHIAAGQSENPF